MKHSSKTTHGSLSVQQQNELLSALSGWTILDEEVAKLQKAYKFENFSRALAFTNELGQLAETHNHHPSITTEWGRVTVYWWSHDAGGVCSVDFELAAKTDECFNNNYLIAP